MSMADEGAAAEREERLACVASVLAATIKALSEGCGLAVNAEQTTQPDLADVLTAQAEELQRLVREGLRANHALSQREQRLMLAFDAAAVAMWDWDMKAGSVEYSAGWNTMLGYRAGELPTDPDTILRIMHPDDQAQYLETTRRYLTEKRTGLYYSEQRLRGPDGGYRWISSKGRVVEYDRQGRAVRAIGVSHDISVRKVYEQAMEKAKLAAEAASRAKGDFLANMSHEIRTPLNGVIGMTELCLETRLDGMQRKYLEMAHTSAKSLLLVINDVLDFSKIEANKIEIERVPFDLRGLVRDATAPLALQAQEKSLVLDVRLPPACIDPSREDYVVIGDPGRLGQVLINLVGNAIKFTRAGRVDVSIAQTGQADAPWRFEVRDTGIGVAPDRLSSIFESFSQADTSIARNFGGTGLGLTISARLVELMGGRLQVESGQGVGTRFWFDLALEPAHGSSDGSGGETGYSTDGAEAASIPRRLNVLVAEDHPINQLVARKALEKHGCVVTMAGNGEEAIRRFERGHFDMVFMDIQMPELDGFGATLRIRALEAERGLPRTPIIAMTAHAMAGYADLCRAGDMDGYVSKPLDHARLRNEIARLAPAR